MSKSPHVDEKDLIQFDDGEMQGRAAAAIEIHLKACSQCRSRLEELRRVAAAYAEYHTHVLKPSLDLPREWPPLEFPATDQKSRFHFRPAAWWAAAAFSCCLLLFALFFYSNMPQRRMGQLLAQAATRPAPLHRRLQVVSNGRVWYRPAVLRRDSGNTVSTGLEHTQSLFVKANYSWDDPLSARSFAAWRNQLHSKRDQVSSIQNGDGTERFYRLRTETPQGTLRMASLTLRADTLGPVSGAFHFENQEEVTMADSGETPAAQPAIAAKQPVKEAVESKLSAEDELRVFAALNAIGADVGEPLTVDLDPSKHHVVVSGVGIKPDREREVRHALERIPNTEMHFASGQPLLAGNPRGPRSDTNAGGSSAPLRHTMEARAGGPQQFQSITDEALDTSASLVTQAYALNVLAQKFPPAVESGFGVTDRETLRSLRSHHILAIEKATTKLRAALAPLLNSPPDKRGNPNETPSQPGASWQAGAPQLLEESKLLDTSLSRLLAGSYSQEAGEDALSGLPDELQKTEALARSEEMAP